jgi:hypothetical protein
MGPVWSNAGSLNTEMSKSLIGAAREKAVAINILFPL